MTRRYSGTLRRLPVYDCECDVCGSCNDGTLLSGGLSIVNTTAVTSIDGFTKLAVIGRLDTALNGVEYSVVATGMAAEYCYKRRLMMILQEIRT